MTAPGGQLHATDVGTREPGGSVPAPGVGDHWGIVLTFGIVTLGLAVVLSFRPDATLKFLAVVIAIEFLLRGLLNLVGAVRPGPRDSAVRVLLALSGIVAVLVGLVCLRAPQQTLALIGLVLGLWWVLQGLVDVVHALMPGSVSVEPRAWTLLRGLITAGVGAFVLLDPQMSLKVLLVVVALWLYATGLLTVLAALAMRSAQHRAPSR